MGGLEEDGLVWGGVSLFLFRSGIISHHHQQVAIDYL
jgi:hypothetical protein